jgi:hypothetical protein
MMPETVELEAMVRRKGGCMCGAVRYTVAGAPLRVGLCHCADCRRFGGSVFSAYGIWQRAAFDGAGDVTTYAGRSFCPLCGSRLYSLTAGEAEVMLGSLDQAPTDLIPSYELWIKRRERWLQEMPWAEQFDQDRPDV